MPGEGSELCEDAACKVTPQTNPQAVKLRARPN